MLTEATPGVVQTDLLRTLCVDVVQRMLRLPVVLPVDVDVLLQLARLGILSLLDCVNEVDIVLP
jgi:hypothetical protein